MTALMKKITLLLIMLPSSLMVSVLASSMTQIIREYSQYGESLVTMILTVPNLTVMLGLFTAPILVKKFPVKPLILAGLILFTVCNVTAVWCEHFYSLLLLRAIGGVGCGMILPLQATILATYPEKERATLMGLGATVGCLVAAILAAVSGLVASLNWRYVFFLYLINVISLILAIIYLPDTLSTEAFVSDEMVEVTDAVAERQIKIADFRKIIGVYYILLIGGYCFFSILGSQIAPYLEYTKLGGPAESGLMTSISLVGSMISGLALGNYTRKLKGYSMAGLFGIATVAFTLLWFAPNLATIGVAAFMMGFVSALGSCVVNYELSCILPLELFTSVAAGISFFVFGLQFIAPMMFLGVLELVPSGSFRTTFLLYAAIQLLFMLFAYCLQKSILERK